MVLVLLTESGIPSYHVRQHKALHMVVYPKRGLLAYKIDVLSHDCNVIILCQ